MIKNFLAYVAEKLNYCSAACEKKNNQKIIIIINAWHTDNETRVPIIAELYPQTYGPILYYKENPLSPAKPFVSSEIILQKYCPLSINSRFLWVHPLNA